MPDHHLTVAEGLARLPGPRDERFVELFYAPEGGEVPA